MISAYFFKGFIIGFTVAAPVGPIGILVIRRTLAEGRVSGFVTGMGAAIADTVYGVIAGYGFTAVSVFLITQEFRMKIIGGIFLFYLGIKSLLSIPPEMEGVVVKKNYFNNFISTFLLTITNPATILFFLAVFSGLGLNSENTDHFLSMTLVLGVFIGSAIWWLLLSTVAGYFNSKTSRQSLVWINRVSGLVICLFGIWAIFSAII